MSDLKDSDSLAYNNLKKIIESGRIPHSFLIEGSTKEKRLKMALHIAKSVVCTSDNKPCGVCNGCRTADNYANPDISFVSPQNDKKFISVDRIRALRQEAFVMPHSAEKRVFIIEDAENLNEQGQNALLKILEEPPKTVVFILLVSSRTTLLETVVSRCSVFILSHSSDNITKLEEDAREFLSFLFENREYDMLVLTKKYEKDRQKAQDFLNAVKCECVNMIKTGELSNYRAKILSKIFDKTGDYIRSVTTNVNMTMLFCAMVSKFKSFVE